MHEAVPFALHVLRFRAAAVLLLQIDGIFQIARAGGDALAAMSTCRNGAMLFSRNDSHIANDRNSSLALSTSFFRTSRH